MSYAKLFGSITESSLWSENKDVRLLFVSMLARADSNGFVEASVSGLARIANLTKEEADEALVVLTSPDPDSKNPAFDGRRVDKVEGGFVLLNYAEYRDRKNDTERREYMREYMANYRAGKQSVNTGKQSVNSVSSGKPQLAPTATATATATATELKTGRFAPPSFEEAMLEGSKQGLPQAQVEEFMAYYESNGWKVGRNKMVSWSKAMAGWKVRWEGAGRTGMNGQPTDIRPMTKEEMLKESMR